MKKAAGEANIAVITIILVGIVMAAGLFLIPRLMKKAPEKACCTKCGGVWNGTTCDPVEGVDFDQDEYDTCIER